MIIKFGTRLYRQIVGIPKGTNSASLVGDLILFCYEKYFMNFEEFTNCGISSSITKSNWNV